MRKSITIIATFALATAFASQRNIGQGLRNAPLTPWGMADVLRHHAEWLQSNGAKGAQADLRQLSLEGVSAPAAGVLVGRVVLRAVDLRRADFRQASLRSVDFTGANLQEARFDQSNLRWAILHNADLRRANFNRANMQEVDLTGANLNGAALNAADLSGADLTGAKCVTRQQLALAILDDRSKLSIFEVCAAQR